MEALRYYVPRWLQTHLEALTEADRPRALAIFDKIIAIYAAMPPELTKSGIWARA